MLKVLFIGPLAGVAAAAVHTTGVNWDGVLAVSASVCTLIAIALYPLARLFIHQMKEAMERSVRRVVHEDVFPRLDDIDHRLDSMDHRMKKLEEGMHDKEVRLSRLEAFREGRESAAFERRATEAARTEALEEE